MAGLGGLKTIKGRGGLGRRSPSTDAIFGLMVSGVLPVGIAAYGDVVKLVQVEDAELLGIDASYDANNGILVYHHISEFFRLQPNGTLYIAIYAQTETVTTLTDGNNSKLEQFIKSEVANREIKFIGLVLNREAEYTPFYIEGIDNDVILGVAKSQVVFSKLITENIIVDGILIGAEIDPMTIITTLYDVRGLAAENVSLVIGQDPKIKEVCGFNYAGVGTALGALAIRMVHESLGSVNTRNKPDDKIGNENYSLTDSANELWLSAALSSGRLVNDLSATDIDTLTTKGYIFVGYYEGYAGMYFNDSSTLTDISNDYAYIEANRTWGKAARIAINALIPKIKSDVDIDDATGYIDSMTIDSWVELVKNRISQMLKDEEVSAFSFYINPAQNVLSGEPIATELSVTPKGIAREIKSTIGFINPFV